MIDNTAGVTATCQIHGEYVFQPRFFLGRLIKTPAECPVCRDERKAKEEAARFLLEEQRRQRVASNNLRVSGIPPRFLEGRKFIATTIEQTSVFDFARKYAEEFDDVLKTRRCAVFIGRVGTGKTLLACSIARNLIENGYTARYTTLSAMFLRIKGTWRRESEESEEEAIDAFASPDLLVLDEVGIGYGSETEQKLIFDVIDRRYQQCLPTLLISNLDIEGVKTTVGPRIFDRLREDGATVVAFDWESHRGAKQPSTGDLGGGGHASAAPSVKGTNSGTSGEPAGRPTMIQNGLSFETDQGIGLGGIDTNSEDSSGAASVANAPFALGD